MNALSRDAVRAQGREDSSPAHLQWLAFAVFAICWIAESTLFG